MLPRVHRGLLQRSRVAPAHLIRAAALALGDDDPQDVGLEMPPG